MSLGPGSLLNGRYRILQRVGGGGMGDVYQAEDTQLNDKIVAVKEMRQRGLDDQDLATAINLFDQEVRLLSNLNHPNIPDIHDHFTVKVAGAGGSESEQFYLVMKFIAGESLEERWRKAPGRRLEVKETLQIGMQLCNALGYLHTSQPQIIFRDLKPSNVMLTADGHVYLIDFGIARLFKPGQTKDTVSFGTEGYMAPEAARLQAQTTPQSDIYSLGATLHQLLSGRHPSSNTPLLWDFPSLGLTAPAGLETLILQMVKLRMSERPVSMAAVKQKLQSMADELVGGQTNSGLIKTDPGGSGGPGSVIIKPPPETAKKKGATPGAIVAIFLAVLFAVGVGVANLNKPNAQNTPTNGPDQNNPNNSQQTTQNTPATVQFVLLGTSAPGGGIDLDKWCQKSFADAGLDATGAKAVWDDQYNGWDCEQENGFKRAIDYPFSNPSNPDSICSELYHGSTVIVTGQGYPPNFVYAKVDPTTHVISCYGNAAGNWSK